MEQQSKSSSEEEVDEVMETQETSQQTAINFEKYINEENEMEKLQITYEEYDQELPPEPDPLLLFREQQQQLIEETLQKEQDVKVMPVQEVKDVKQFQDIFVPQQNVEVEEQKTQIPKSAAEEIKNQNARSYQSS